MDNFVHYSEIKLNLKVLTNNFVSQNSFWHTVNNLALLGSFYLQNVSQSFWNLNEITKPYKIANDLVLQLRFLRLYK